MATGRSRKKNKFKFNERSSSSVRDQYTDPAFTDDVRHLALPARRNSGPESEALKMFGKKKSKSMGKEEHSSHYSLRLERRKKSTQANNYSAEYLCKNSSSSESLDNIISSYKLKGRKGFSLDRDIQSFDVEHKPQSKPKRSSWFLRDKSRDKKSKSEKFLKRASLDFTLTYDAKQEKPRSKTKPIQRQNAADYTGDSSTTTPQEEVPEQKKPLSKFQIGKRFLKGEIGIRSFNYYLLKEGLKKNQGKNQKQDSITTKPTYKSKSEENIYEEIYFYHDQPTPKPKAPPELPPFNKQSSVPLKAKKPMSDDGNCMNCEICLQEAVQEKNSVCSMANCDKCAESHHHKLMTGSLSGSEGYAQVTKKINEQSIYDFFQQQQKGQTVLQFQSYNPSNPNVYKLETTPVAFEYTPIEEQIYQMELNQHYARAQQQQNFSGDGKVVPKSSSSSDSIKGQNQRQRQQQQLPQQPTEFYTRPNYFYPTGEKQSRKDQSNSIYRTDSSNSIRSENSLNKIYNSKNSSQKSNHSNKSAGSNHNRDDPQLRQDMSDSSLGDSLFSSDANKRYFGSSESCRFNYECSRRRCSLENEKCSFSDTCRYECNLRNCDCSSSYFSSDFDDTNIYNTTNNGRMLKSHHTQQPHEYQPQQIYDQKSNRYAEDFIKHVSNVKRRSQNVPFEGNNVLISSQQIMTASIYEVPKTNPKRLDTEVLRIESDNNKITATGAGDEVNPDKMLIHGENNKAKSHAKATGTVPKLSSSISSTESKKKSGQRHDKENNENKQKESCRNQEDESESLLKAKVLLSNEKLSADEKMLSSETLSATLDEKATEKPKSDNKKAPQSKSEQQKVIDADDDDDDVFLDNSRHQEGEANEQKMEQPVVNKQLEEQLNDAKKAKVALEVINVLRSAANSPRKALSKAPIAETLKVEVKQAENTKLDENKQINEKKNNNKAARIEVPNESDDDDSVFINENKPKKASKTSAKPKTDVQPASINASSVMLNVANVSSSNIKSIAPAAAQIHSSRDSNVTSETVVRNQEKQLKPNENNVQKADKSSTLKQSNDSSDQLDFSNIPLPDIPTKKKQLSKGKSLSKDSLSISTTAKIQSKWKQLTEKDYFKKMHYRNSSLEKKTPTYLFGENASNTKPKDGIFLNRSGWIQTNQRVEKGSESRKENINKLKAANSKIEELISRNEARKANQQSANSKDENVTILKIDPKSEPRAIPNDRPGFLPVKSNLARDGPPPTPILSPPPAFQDHKIRNRIIEMKNGTRIQLSVTDSDNKTSPAQISKGMVFSRSFEYDSRKTAEFNENFSRSFDFDFQLKEKSGINKNFLSRYGKSTTFASLTGVSPNYLTKKEKPNDGSPSTSMTSIFPKVIPGNKVKMGNPNYYNPSYKSVDDGISRRSQFTRPGMANTYRSLESGASTINNRLNSCDSGARSDFSNDDLDEDQNDDDDDPSSSLALSYKSAATTSSYLEPMKNNRNITKTLLNQQQATQFKKTRSMTPETSFDDYDLLTVNRSNSKKQRPLTPEKRPVTPEILHKSSKLTTSQTSLMSRQSSGSRQSTLERQLKRYEEGRLSRSSSSSSEADNNNRRTHRPPFKTNFGDYKIRRSRSLQLSERSPNRSQLQKVVVRIGNTPSPQSTTTTNVAKHREKPDYAHTRSKTTLNMPSKYNSQSLRNSDNSLTSSTQTKSFEMLDFNGKSSMDYGFESDSKSKSFDDDFCFNTKVARNGNNTRNVFSGNRAFSQDRVLLVPQTASKSLRNSPRNYGSRLYDHEALYDVATRRAATRSPIMNFNNRIPVNPPLSRERSPISNRRSRDRERDNYKKQANNNFLKPRTTTTPNRSPNRSPSDSDDSINENANKVLKDKSLVAEYLFGLKRKQQANLNRSGNQSGTPSSSGSCCTSSSCEYWPHSGVNPSKYPSLDDKSYVNGAHNKANVANDSDSSGCNVKVSVNTQRQKQQAFRSTTVTINGGQTTSLKHVNKPNNSSIIFLGDCEMPITKSATRKNSGSDSSANKFADGKAKDSNTQKIQITGRPNGELKQQFAASSQQARTQNYNRGKFSTPSYSSDATVKRRHFTRLQSRSLPKSFMRSRNLSSDANELSAIPLHSPLQMRAVSSPSLTETPTEVPATSPSYSTKPESNGHIPNNHELNDRGHQASSGSVLQKFKKTFFKNGKSNVPVVDSLESNETKHHRFGPLVWRSSKERRKTKSHRRDKCNSGDSGIQVELENDENLSENVPSQRSMDISPQSNVKVRRANSAKVSTTSSIKASVHRNEPKGSTASSINTKRSLSQPSDLDAIVCEGKMMNNLENIKHIDDDDGSDTDSLTSNHVEEIEDDGQHGGVVYAEVLYQFQAGGPQELSLEKGSLVEVLKRESGPWWWGRLKYDAVLSSDSIEIQQGWFPKDFVKVIPTFGHNRKIINQSSSDYDCDNHLATLPPTSAAPSISSSQSNSEIMRDNVIKELLETEINYVKLLNSLVEGFIKEMKEHPDVFSLESIFLIFSNMESIYRFQQTFLEALRLAIPNGRIAEVFLEFQSAFMVYSQYCNTYPRALMELENFSGNKEAAGILENCRIAQNLPELPLSAHLLAPIQRICRYPLHLSELVKHSRTRKEILLKLDVHQLSKPDLETIDSKEMFEVALNAMKRVTEMVNEGKRHSEYLSRMQSRFESFQGPSINVHSTRLFLQTDAIRVSPNLWNNTYTLFLFDRQLIYCKKDLLKRTSYIYKGRIFLDNCRILNLPDGKMFGVNLKNALRMFCETRGKWFDFCFRSNSSKLRFLNTLSAERQFCGSSLFVSELAPGLDDDNLSDDTNALSQEYDERGIDVDPQFQAMIGNVPSNGSMESPMKQQKFSDSLPKKPRKLSKEAPSQIIIDYNPSSTSSNMSKRRLGNWFRKSKSTNSTPSQSPTHHPLVATSTVPSIVNHSDSNSSSQSSPVNYPRQKFKETSVVGTS